MIIYFKTCFLTDILPEKSHSNENIEPEKETSSELEQTSTEKIDINPDLSLPLRK